jgi:hypothetical protein
MWKKMKEISKDELSELRHLKKIKIYADEDIEEGIVELLREWGVNIKSARELGFRGRPDSFHAAFCMKLKRFLLTKNARDFLNDRKLPFNRTYGVIAIRGDMNNIKEYLMTLNRLNDIINYGEIYYRKKIKLSPNEIQFRYIDYTGCIQVRRFKFDGQEYYEWINN